MLTSEVIQWLKDEVSASSRLRLDSRKVQAGDVFIAVSGTSTNGALFVEKAIANGAGAILVDASLAQDLSSAIDVPLLKVSNLRAQLGAIAHEWYGRPSEKLSVIAVTGTNGKTSCTQWIAQALNQKQVLCATIGTLGALLPDGTVLDEGLTTPDVVTMHDVLAQFYAQKVEAVVVEASSIGIEQGRLDSVKIKVAGFTNLTRDHLDYHLTMERYEQAKAALFTRTELEYAVINIDDAAGTRIIEQLNCQYYSYSLKNPEASFLASDCMFGDHGLVFQLKSVQGEAQVVPPVVGEHNVANLLLVAGVLKALNWPFGQIVNALSKLSAVDGRLDIVTLPLPNAPVLPLVVVDYAHTPDALEHALLSLKPVVQARKGRLLCVFGCGGNRDKGKRPIMAAIATKESDYAVITSDNPRQEDPLAIIDDMKAGIDGIDYGCEPDRALAILQTVLKADSKDVILIAGKGHETYQDVNGIKTFFDDRQWAKLALTKYVGVDVSTDSRNIPEGALFVALKGEKFDGHDYVVNLDSEKVCAALVSSVQKASVIQIKVADTERALQLLAKAWRLRFDIPVISVAGSNGKTTTKEMISTILEQAYGAEGRLATQGNLNNHIGVPLTLLKLNESHKAAVIELGMNHPGEIAVIADLTQATTALITNAQREHQEFMQTVEAVAYENGEALKPLPADGVAVYPDDEAYASIWLKQSNHCQRKTFGLDTSANVFAKNIKLEVLSSSFFICADGQTQAVQLPVPGLHNVRNALAAATAALSAGVALNNIVTALGRFVAAKGRLQLTTDAGYYLIDDTYNANPDSVRAAIDVLAQMDDRTVLVLGDMGEVGDQSAQMHAEVGAYAKDKGIRRLLVMGADTHHAVSAFGDGAQHFDKVEDLVAALFATKIQHILVKGSRFMRMERIVQTFKDQIKTAGDR